MATSSDAACGRHRSRVLEELAFESAHEQDRQKIATLVSIAKQCRHASPAPSRVACQAAFLHEPRMLPCTISAASMTIRVEREAGQRHHVERSPEQVEGNDGEEQRDRDRRTDYGQCARAAQKYQSPPTASRMPMARLSRRSRSHAAAHDARVPTVRRTAFFRERAGVQLRDGLLTPSPARPCWSPTCAAA